MVSTVQSGQPEGLDVLALRTPTLPPATTTNTSLVGRRDVWIVDPATPFDSPRARLLEALEALEGEGRRPRGIVLTHHHPDHVGAAEWLRARLDVPIHAHRRTAELLEPTGVPVDRLLAEGDVLEGSDAPDDRWEILHTPGHASGHIVLWQPERGGLVAGDMVAAVGTIVVEPPDGHMATYIAQLERLAALAPRWLVPAHGELVREPVAKLEGYVKHRLMREARVAGALGQGPAGLGEVTRRSYPDVPASLHPLAERSCLAHLIKLEEEGRAERGESGRWRSVTPAR